MELRVDVCESIAEVDREAWNGLVEAAGAPVFYDHDFLAAYERARLEPEIASSYLLVREKVSGELVAAAPVYVFDPVDPFDNLPHTDPAFDLRERRGSVTHIWHCYDTCVLSAARPEALAALCSAMHSFARHRGAEFYGFINVDASRWEAGLLRQAGFEPRFLCDRFVLDLSACRTMDDYLRALRQEKRHELTRQVRRAAEAGVEVRWLEPPFAESDESDESDEIDEIVALCRATAGRYGGESYYPAESFGRFLRGAGPTLRLLAVRFGPTLVGAIVCFLHGGRLHTWAGGARYDLTRVSPYYVGFYEAIRFAIAHRVARLEGGRANERFKLRYGLRPIPLLAALKPV
jgi:predicted N-acyltransferase